MVRRQEGKSSTCNHSDRAFSLRCIVQRSVSVVVLALLVSRTATAQSNEEPLLKGFRNPPQAARPRVWWHWMNGNVSREGAELDLAWMRRIGIGGVHTFSGALFEPNFVSPPVPFMSEPWKDAFRTTTLDARKAGMEVSIAGSPGWSETGGVWVAPEDAMKKYVWSETSVEGGVPFTGRLATPPSATGPFQALKRKPSSHVALELTRDVYGDSAVVAFRTPRAAVAAPLPTITSNSREFNLSLTEPNGLGAPLSLSLNPDQAPLYIQAAYREPVAVHAVTLGIAAPADLEVQASGEEGVFHTVLRVPADRSEQTVPESTFSFPAVRAKFVRVVLTPVPPSPFPGMPKGSKLVKPKVVSLTRVSFHTIDRVNRFEAKAGFTSSVDFDSGSTPQADVESIVKSDEVIDLTSHLHADGTLDWTPPPGSWTVLRIGYSLTGQTNAPAEPAATGLEVDKLDAALVRKYMEHYLGLYQDATGRRLREAGVQNVLTDSWEAGVQNWTPSMLAQFQQRRNYYATRYLPVLAGWVVDDAQTSDRFLWDFHRSLKEMLADDHYGTLARVLHEHQMGYYTEAQGDFPRAIGDGMTMKSRSDIPTGEFWYRAFSTDPGQPPLKADLEESASVAHVYGKRYAAAESLTVGALSDPWSFSPAMLKPVIDEIFAHGINRILIHESHLQPFVDKKPGLELGIFGQYFNRNDTWAEQAKPWVDYLARTSYMLQQGHFVADVAYFYGEDHNLTELFLHGFNTDVPAGYAYDYINPEALLKLLSVRGGKLVTPSGMSYRVLYLPTYVDRLTLTALRKVRELVAAGAVVAGPKPKGGLGLQDDDRQIQEIADEVWGDAKADSTPHSFGAGRVYQSTNLATVLRAEGVQRDVEVTSTSADGKILTLHRSANDREIYFIANQREKSEDVTLRCRIHGMAPEIWHAESGTMQPVSFHADATSIRTVVHLDPNEALFLVFHKSALRSRTLPKKQSELLRSIAGPWTVRFEPGRGAPETVTFAELAPWDESTQPGVKYFSGHATYTKVVSLPSMLERPSHHVLLDLGEVREIAEVSVNGSAPSIVWHSPYELDITKQIKSGENTISITVTNLWPNRLIGDKQPNAIKYAYAPQSPYGANSVLLRSGLIGPVRLVERW